MKRARRGAGGPADKEIDRLLRRTARPDAGVRPDAACLDAETVAALTDDTLSPHERAAAEAHAADCDRCLAVLATVVTTAPPPVVQERPGWLSLRWLVPLTAGSVAVTAWMIVQPATNPPRPAAPTLSIGDAAKPAEPTLQPGRETQRLPLADALEKKQEKSRESADSVARDALASRRADTVAQTPAPAAPPAAPPAATAATAAPQAAAQEERLQFSDRQAKPDPLTIPSTDPDVRWRIAAQSVERSIDGGRTWRPQPTGTNADLLAGSAPSATVCWIVGRGGVVLLSTDGQTWRQLDPPSPNVDLVAVTARDGTVAAVTTVDGRTYRTADGGLTWALQENPAASF